MLSHWAFSRKDRGCMHALCALRSCKHSPINWMRHWKRACNMNKSWGDKSPLSQFWSETSLYLKKRRDMNILQFLGLVSEDHLMLLIVIFSLIIFSLYLQIFDGNCDHFTPVVNILEHGTTARYVRFYPVTYNYVCMRVEVYGCDS